jgi:hypothetical protein
MTRRLKIIFSAILLAMIAVTTWASLDSNLLDGFAYVLNHPWGIATLADAYFGFLTFYVWVYYKESTFSGRLIWLGGILFFGNIAMAAYMLILLSRLPQNPTMADVLLKQPAR